jgi:hypothetical protein
VHPEPGGAGTEPGPRGVATQFPGPPDLPGLGGADAGFFDDADLDVVNVLNEGVTFTMVSV